MKNVLGIMSDYELQFQADLERAQALSLESLALEQFRKRKVISTSTISETECDEPLRPSRSRSTGAPPALPPPPRRPQRRPRASLPGDSLSEHTPEGARSCSCSPTPCEDAPPGADLISFTSPSSAGRAHMELKECIEHIHRLNQQTDQLALVPVPKGNTKLTRSNSSVSTYSNNSQDMRSFPSNNPMIHNPINPVIAYPSNSPFVQYQYSPNINTNPSPSSNLYPNINSSITSNFATASKIAASFPAPLPGFVNQPQLSSQPNVNAYSTLGNINVPSSGQPNYQNPFYNTGNTTLGSFKGNNQQYASIIQPNSQQANVTIKNNITGSNYANNVPLERGIKNSLSAHSLSNMSTASIKSSSAGQNMMNESKDAKVMNKPSSNSDLRLASINKSSENDIKVINDRNTLPWRDMQNKKIDNNLRINTRNVSEPSNFSKSDSGGPFTSNINASSNLIDLAGCSSGIGSVRVSVLEAFDPLMSDQNINDYMCSSECSSSVYEEYDPLDFLYGGSESSKDTPVYATVNKKPGGDRQPSPLPSPPPKSLPPQTPVTRRNNTLNSKLFECITLVKTRRYEPELIAFHEMIKDLRSTYVFSDPVTNPGYVIASKSESQYPPNTSIKLLVYHDKPVSPITFTCDVESTVEHVILHVVCELEGEIKEDISAYTLRVWGMSEYLTSGSCLSEYDYVRQCLRLEKDVLLSLQSTRDRSLARTERDDTRDNLITLDQLVPNQSSTPPISYFNLSILLETLERELTRLTASVAGAGAVKAGAAAQAVKAICTLLGGVETNHISTSLMTLMHACAQRQPDSSIMKPEIMTDDGDYCSVTLRQATIKDTIGLHCQRLREAVKGFIAMYCRSNRVDFELEDSQYSLPGEESDSVPISTITESALFCVEAVHRAPVNWNHDEFIIHAQIYHGTRPLKGSQSSTPISIDTNGFYPRIMFDTWLALNDVSIANLPKEARLVLTLSGRTLAKLDQNGTTAAEKEKAAEANQRDATEKQDDNDDDEEVDVNSKFVHIEQEELGWASIQLFDFHGKLVSGSYILPIWPVCADKRLGPAPDPTDCPHRVHPLVHIEIPSYSIGGVSWEEVSDTEVYPVDSTRYAFSALDAHTQTQLQHLIEQGPYQRMPSECREILWEKRHYLVGLPGAIPLVLLASMNWDSFSKRQLMNLLDQWTSPSPHDALHMLLPCFPDEGVRERAVRWLSDAPGDLLASLTPQLCLGLRYERYAHSPLARLLLAKSMESPRFAHRLYWQLVHDIPGNSPQNSCEEFLGISLDGEPILAGSEMDSSIIASSRWVRRNQMILRALLAIVGENLAQRLLKQQLLVKGLTEVASSVKNCKESIRNRILQSGVENLAPLVTSQNICLPLSISLEVHDIDVKSCSYFPSNTLPLKINFVSSDNAIIPAIFKVGDDLRQDSLVLQVMRVMDQLWLKEGLDLRMVTFEAVPTQLRKGMIEMVCSAETLRCIQVEWGLTGSFKDKPIAEWLAKHNPSELEYERAVTNFTASCAGYSVATYLLGICDRHNDNIMLKTSGHLFHIDFGKFLGDAQMFGNFKRDRTAFVLTPDMAYVINGGERPSQRFHHFVELCCAAFNIVRKHHNLILHLFSLMASSGVAGVSASSVGYVRAALLPGQTAAEAAAAFARLINSALRSRFTPINFFLHNLAQLRAGDQSASSTELLSFMPKTYTMAQEGRLTNVEVLGYEKRYDPEKYYVYALRIFREGQATPFVLYRSYKHFTELYQKLCVHYPLAKVHSLPVGLHMGRSNTKQVAERRYGDVQAFLTSLFNLADEIAHSSLVYTFFHPLLRDQQDVGPQRIKNKSKSEVQCNVSDGGVGALKISIQYSAGVLSVLILHAQSLPMIMQGVPPSTYVKVYLIPDPSKETKRKTRVLKRNCHPSFMEMLEYRLPLEVVRGRELQATVWHHDSLQENQFLGGVQLPLAQMPLTSETTEWYPLTYIPR